MASQVWPCKSTCGHSKLHEKAQFKRRQYFVPLWSLKDCIKPDYKIVTYDIEGGEVLRCVICLLPSCRMSASSSLNILSPNAAMVVAFQEDQPGLFQSPANRDVWNPRWCRPEATTHYAAEAPHKHDGPTAR